VGARRFFQTTRGRIIAELRRRSFATAQELAEHFVISTNAVRQHLTALVEEGLVSEQAARRGPTKPTLEYALTPDADALFPQHYDRLLNAVLREVREQFGDSGVTSVFAGIASRVVQKHGAALTSQSVEQRVENVATILRQRGVEVNVEREGDRTIVLSEHNCPYAQSVAEHPEVCTVVHQLLETAAPGNVVKTSSIADGARACRFEVQSVTESV
jgi:predicted ArsR family transcriptional regulator